MSLTTWKKLLQLTISSSLVIGNICCNFPAQAGILLKPIFLVVESERGQGKSTLTINNTGAEPIRVRLSAAPFTYTEAGYFQRLPSGQKSSDLTPYLRFAPQEITIPPHKEQKVRLVSLLPPSLPDGEYRTAITVENLQESTRKGFSVGFSLRLVSLVNVHKGKLIPKLTIDRAFYQQDNHQLDLLVRNQGKATARPDITWNLKQGSKDIASGKTTAVLLSDNSRQVLLNRQDARNLKLEKGIYQLTGEFLWTQAGQQERIPFNVELQY
jgi:hypothetical protein